MIPVYEVVKKLIGPINPVGDTNIDEVRFDNLKATADLVDSLLTDIDAVTCANIDRAEFSRKRAGEYAKKFFDQIGIKE